MKQDDFFLKQIDLLGKILGKILSELLNKRNSSEIFDIYNFSSEKLKQELNVELDFLLSLNEKELIDYISIDKQFENIHIEKIGEIFFTIGNYSNNENSKKCLQKSLELYNYINSKSTTYSFERIKKIDKLNDLINQF
jgi:hypothetical protein